MTGLGRRIIKTSSALSIIPALVGPVSAQDWGSAMLFGLGKSVISEGEELLNDASDKLSAFLESAEQGQGFPSGMECLGALQVAVNAGTVVANILPFSSVETFEDKRGPIAKFRVLLNGEKVHLEAFCDEEQMSAVPLPWGEGNPKPEKVTKSSLDAVAGLLLLLQAQGAFEKDAVQTSEIQPSELPISGPPMTSDERDALRVAVQQCWNVGSLSSEALRTTVVVAFSMTEDGRPLHQTLRMLSYAGGSTDAARQTFETVRRAIIRCGANGFDLPRSKYLQWQAVEMMFSPENMRIR